MKANRRSLGIESDDKGMIEMLPTVAFAVIMLFAILYIGTYINGTISSTLVASYGPNVAGNWRTELENRSVSTMTNLTGDYDSVIEIVTVAAIIVVLTIPLLAVVAMKRFF